MYGPTYGDIVLYRVTYQEPLKTFGGENRWSIQVHWPLVFSQSFLKSLWYLLCKTHILQLVTYAGVCSIYQVSLNRSRYNKLYICMLNCCSVCWSLPWFKTDNIPTTWKIDTFSVVIKVVLHCMPPQIWTMRTSWPQRHDC